MSISKVAVLVLGLVCVVSYNACNKVAFTSNPNQLINTNNVNNTIPPLYCAAGNQGGTNVQYFPTQCLVPQSLANNAMGVEINNAYQLSNKVFSILSDAPGGTTQAVNLYVELATYIEPDTIIINAYDSSANKTQLLNICNISTWSVGDQTKGIIRPYSDTILQFSVALPVGTVRLEFDYTNSNTPTYVGVWNLNEFSKGLMNGTDNPFPSNKLGQFRSESAPLSLYNDNSDPTPGSRVNCPNQ